MSDTAAPPKAPSISVCGIGASAGGVEALQQFFGAVPPDLGIAYVVILHLAPDHRSELPSILAQWTRMPVLQVSDHQSVTLAPDHVYVIAPDRKLEITDSTIAAAPFDQPHGQRTAIDLFFRSMALEHGDGFAVVLSGSGSDGAVGAKLIKERGGLVLVQDPAEAPYASMPAAVIATGVADLVLPVRAIGERLAGLVRNKIHLRPLFRAPDQPVAIPDDDRKALRSILELLHTRTGLDFSKYKRATVLRRLSRRMQLLHQLTIPGYLAYLRSDPREVRALHDDLLITVTTFFRDPPAWTALREQVIAPMLDDGDSGNPVRAWVAGCATGEEAYSLAILFDEALKERHMQRNVIIFASDVDETALIQARDGLYPQAIAADVSEVRLERYFRVEDSHYRVTREIRDRVVFAAHSVFRDPPFSRLDLVACRNLLIYFDRELQDQVMTVFRYACVDHAGLFLGASENADEDLFRPLDRKFRLFAARPTTDGTRPQFPDALAASTPHRTRATGAAITPFDALETHVSALEEMSPPSALTDERGNVLHLSPGASHFFRQAGGPLARRITDLVRPELRDELQNLLNRVVSAHSGLVSSFVPVAFNGASHRVALLCQKRVRQERVDLLITFLDGGEMVGFSGPADSENLDPLRDLRDQLRLAEQRADSIRDEQYLTTEDLRAANEELQSLNEEYRSTTEELETSKEELQTLNQALKLKLDEISRAHNDLDNLMAATSVATLFLSSALRIKRFTPQLEDIFKIRPQDIDRPIGDLTHVLDYAALEKDARQVLDGAPVVERESVTHDGRVFAVRVGPYRSETQEITGVVVTFIDVTPLKRAEDELRESRRQLEIELDVVRRLHEMALNVAISSSMLEALEHVLTAAIELHAADLGHLHLLDPESGRLRIVAHRGFRPGVPERFVQVGDDDQTTAGRSLRTRRISQVADVSDHPGGESAAAAAIAAGFRAVQSVPLVSRSGSVVGVLTVHFREPHAFTDRDTQLGIVLGQQAAELIESRTQQLEATARRTAVAEVRDLLRRLVTVQEEERRRIAREVHDQLGQQMTGLRMKLEGLRLNAGALPAVGDDVRAVERLAEEIDQSVDFLTWQLRPPAIEHLGFIGALEDLVRIWSARSGVAAECRVIRGAVSGLAPNAAINLYRIAQEALHNIQKHAGASRVSVVFEVRDRLAILIVEDDGRGFIVEDHSADRRRLGLISMRERTLLLGGDLEIESAPSSGTTIFVRIPLGDDQPE